jgi:propane monooxygenase reductase component
MAKHKVRFEPVGIEIEADEEETILGAAFRQGVALFHGCKEGQCATCKQFLLEGDLEMDRYSTFALNEYEAEEGYVLLCRSHAYSDLEIELIYYDEDMMRMGIPIQEVQAEVEVIESLTPEIKRLMLKLVDPPEMAFRAGQFAEIYVPGNDEHRAYSMANTPYSDERAEFIIRVFPDGVFSSLLEGPLKVGDSLRLNVPYGVFMLREDSDSDIIFIGGGTGMAPLLSILRHIAEKGIERNVTFYFGARRRQDLFYIDKIRELGEQLPGEFRFVPALSEPGPDDEWDGETGLITDVVERLEEDLSGAEAYLAGPPPMIDASLPVLHSKGVKEKKIYYDKFTESGAVEGEADKEERGPEQAEEASR